MEHSNTIRYFFSKVKKQSKSEKYFTLQSFASDLGVEVDDDNLYVEDINADVPITLDSISRILIANGCFYIQFEADPDCVLVLELESRKHKMMFLEPSCCRFGVIKPWLLDWVSGQHRLMKYLFVKLGKRLAVIF